MINNVIIQPLENIINFQNFEHARNYLSNVYSETHCLSIIENLSIVLVYYNNIIIILHKFKSLANRQIISQNNTQNVISIS